MARRLTDSQEVCVSLYLTHLLSPTADLSVSFLLGVLKLNVHWGCRVKFICIFLGLATLSLLHGFWSKNEFGRMRR
jgi:hypothetical protein